MKKLSSLFLGSALLIISSFGSVVYGATQQDPVQYQIQELNNKVDMIISNNDANVKDSAGRVMELVNLQMQITTVILTLVGLGITVGGFLFTRYFKRIENRAIQSSKNMDNKVREIGILEETFALRKKELDRLHTKYETKLAEIIKQARRAKPSQKSKLLKLEEEVLDLKRKLSQDVQPYFMGGGGGGAQVWNGNFVPTSTTTSTGTSSFSTTPFIGSATTTTLEPYFSTSTQPLNDTPPPSGTKKDSTKKKRK